MVGAIVLAQRALKESQKKLDDEEDMATKKQKQLAFRTGLWHGFLVGVVGTALVFKYGLGGMGSRNRRR